MCVYIYIHINIYIYIYIYIYIHIRLSIYLLIYLFTHTHTHIHTIHPDLAGMNTFCEVDTDIHQTMCIIKYNIYIFISIQHLTVIVRYPGSRFRGHKAIVVFQRL